MLLSVRNPTTELAKTVVLVSEEIKFVIAEKKIVLKKR
jgi:hypothetical protein